RCLARGSAVRSRRRPMRSARAVPDGSVSESASVSFGLLFSAAERLDRLEAGLLVAHLVLPPALATPALVALERIVGVAVVAGQRARREVRRELHQRVQCPRPRLGHVVAAIEPAREEETRVAELRAVVDLVAQSLAPGGPGPRCECPRVGLHELASILAGLVGPLEHVHPRELDALGDRRRSTPALFPPGST